MNLPSFRTLSPRGANIWKYEGVPARYGLIVEFACIGALRPIFVDWTHGSQPFDFDDAMPTVLRIGDDPEGDPLGPNGYDRASLQRTLKRVAYIALIAGEPIIAPYNTAAWLSTFFRAHTLIIEARWTDEAAWFALVRQHAPKTPMYLISYIAGVA